MPTVLLKLKKKRRLRKRNMQVIFIYKNKLGELCNFCSYRQFCGYTVQKKSSCRHFLPALKNDLGDAKKIIPKISAEIEKRGELPDTMVYIFFHADVVFLRKLKKQSGLCKKLGLA